MKKNGFSFLLLFLFILLLLFPDTAKTGAQEGLFLWYNSIVPILFPFIILSNMMLGADTFFWFLRPFFALKRYVPGFNPWYFYALILGFFCGYPMGAKAVTDLIQTNKITVSEGNRLLPIVNQASPMFLAGYLGVHIFENTMPLKQILFHIYFPPILLYLCILTGSIVKKKQVSLCHLHTSGTKNKKDSMPLSMEHTIWDSFCIIVTVGVYMMIFTILTELCLNLLPDTLILTVGTCFLEFSTGLNQLKGISGLSKALKSSLILALTSFGGFCTAAQTYSITKATSISLKSYLVRKLVLAAFVFILSYSSLASS